MPKIVKPLGSGILVPNTLNQNQAGYDEDGAVSCGGSRFIRVENRQSSGNVRLDFYKSDNLTIGYTSIFIDAGNVEYFELEGSTDLVGSNRFEHLCCVPVARTH